MKLISLVVGVALVAAPVFPQSQRMGQIMAQAEAQRERDHEVQLMQMATSCAVPEGALDRSQPAVLAWHPGKGWMMANHHAKWLTTLVVCLSDIPEDAAKTDEATQEWISFCMGVKGE